MKILIISHEYPPVGGGGANACYNLAIEYSKQKHNVHIVTVWYPGCDTADQDQISIYDNLCIHRIKSPRKHPDHSSFYEMFLFMVKADDVCRRLLKEVAFDICHVFFAIPSGPIAYRLKLRYHLPYVIRFGGGDIPGSQKRFTFIYKLIAPFERRIWHEAEALVANSEGLRLRAVAFDDKKPVIVIPNGVRMPYESLPDNGIIDKADRDVVKMLFVSRLIEGKGLQDIFPDLRGLDDRCRQAGRSIRYVIVGDGPYRQAYEELVHQLDIDDIVEFVGHKSHDELDRFYRDADVFVFPSRSEGMPNVVLEAMSYGLPVVMTPCEGSSELIHDNGYVVNAGDFCDRIWEIANDKELRQSFSDNSIRIAREMFSWSNTANAYIGLFREIANR